MDRFHTKFGKLKIPQEVLLPHANINILVYLTDNSIIKSQITKTNSFV